MNVDLPDAVRPGQAVAPPGEKVVVTSSNRILAPKRMETFCTEITTDDCTWGRVELSTRSPATDGSVMGPARPPTMTVLSSTGELDRNQTRPLYSAWARSRWRSICSRVAPRLSRRSSANASATSPSPEYTLLAPAAFSGATSRRYDARARTRTPGFSRRAVRITSALCSMPADPRMRLPALATPAASSTSRRVRHRRSCRHRPVAVREPRPCSTQSRSARCRCLAATARRSGLSGRIRRRWPDRPDPP